MRHRTVIEQTIFTRVNDLFGLDWTVTLYDLTNTFFEGAAAGNPKAQRGHSKEKRSDCPLVTLGLVLDGSGFVRRSQTFDGAVSEGTTPGRHATGLGGAAWRLGGDGRRDRDRREHPLAARPALSLPGGQPRAPAPVRCHRRYVADHGQW
jgi:hypothetical protein